MKFIDFEKLAALFLKYWDKFLIDGVSYTLALAAITVAFGAVFASVLALMKMSKIPPLRWLSTIYIEIIRGTPMLLQLYFFYFGLPMLIPALNKQKFLCIAIALICNSAAYVSEVIRSGIQAVDPGQKEAALSLGFSESKAMWFVVVPQAVKNILPALGNEFIMIIKDTSLGSTFFIGDLMTQYLVVKGATYLPIEPLVIVGVIYFIMTFVLSKVFGHFERKMKKADRLREVREVLASIDDFSLENTERIVHAWIEQKGYPMGQIMNTLRLALVGAGKGPGMYDVTSFIGKEETLRRIDALLANLKPVE